MPFRVFIALALTGFLTCLHAGALTGTVKSTDGTPVSFAFIGLLAPDFSMKEYALTDQGGAFELVDSGRDGYLVVQPSPTEDAGGLGMYRHEPRVYAMDGRARLDLRLPPAGCLVIRAYDKNGELMRWEDFDAMGTYARQFMYATDLGDDTVSAVNWPVFDDVARNLGAQRENGLPAVVAPLGGPYVVQMLFWETSGYGKLQLKADNAGQGYSITKAGEGQVLILNVELARTAVADLVRRKGHFNAAAGAMIEHAAMTLDQVSAIQDEPARAAAADALLVKALQLRDGFELLAAREAIPKVRQGTLNISLENAAGAPVDGEVSIRQTSHDFQFGVFQGKYNAADFEMVKEAGFNLSTVLLGWAWTDAKTNPNWAALDQALGISAMNELGFSVKIHGSVWLQQFGILPDRVKDMSTGTLKQEALAQQKKLVEVYGAKIALWEAMNEPAATNQVNMPRDDVVELMADSAAAIKAAGLPALVNAPFEIDYGRKFQVYNLDNEPRAPYNLTYSAFLDIAEEQGALKDIDVVGLQFYPGVHLRDDLGNIQGPAVTPSWLVDTLDRYHARFGKIVHITEYSVPSDYGSGWISGYWQRPWDEDMQADYTEAALTLAFADPHVESFTWWDISDADASVKSGGMLSAGGKPKPVFDHIAAMIDGWTTNATTSTENGKAALRGYAGDYEITATSPTGSKTSETVHLTPGETAEITMKFGGTK